MGSTAEKDKYGNFLKSYYHVLHGDVSLSKLSSSTKLVLLLIHSLDNTEKHCWAKNKFLAEVLGLDVCTVSTSIGILENLKLIERTGLGVNRVLISRLPLPQLTKNSEVINQLTKNSEVNSSLQLTKNPIELTRKTKELTKNSIELTRKTNILYNNIDKNNNKGKDINIKTSSTKVELILNKLSKNKREAIQDIFDYWNAYKDGGKWRSHRKITPDMIDVILDNLKKYTVENIYSAIDNYAKVLQGVKYFWDYVWPLSTFLSVKDGKAKDAYKKWWKFLEENFVEENYFLTRGKSNLKQDEKMPDDPNPEFTAKLIKAHRRFSGRKWNPADKEKAKFIQATIHITKKKPNLTVIQLGYLIDDIIECFDTHYFSKGDSVYPGHYCSEFTWNTLLPQYWRAMGVPDDRFFLYREDQVSIKEECS